MTNSFSNIGGGGGSSFISGYEGCTTYKNYIFSNGIMNQGTNPGHGKIKITILKLFSVREAFGTCNNIFQLSKELLFVTLFFSS